MMNKINGFSYITGSQIGLSHIKNGIPCQDAVLARKVWRGESPDYLFMAVSDGVSACSNSDF